LQARAKGFDGATVGQEAGDALAGDVHIDAVIRADRQVPRIAFPAGFATTERSARTVTQVERPGVRRLSIPSASAVRGQQRAVRIEDLDA
jgi:hypothetical protein